MTTTPISLLEIMRARTIIGKHLSPTPLIHYQGLSEKLGCSLYVKHENHQPGGSFKIRGGVNLMHHLKEQGVKGVITFSTGNHGTSVAKSAKLFGLEAVVVLPANSNPAKIELIKSAGAELIEAGANFEEASIVVEKLRKERSLYFVHPANEPHLLNGVGTGFLEIIEELPDIDMMFVPIGAGSELAAAVTVFKTIKPEVKIIAVQAESSPANYLSWKQGHIKEAPNQTFAGGFATGSAFEVPFSIYKDTIDDFIILSEDELKEGIYMALQYTHNLAEGAGAACLRAAFIMKKHLQGKNVVVQMSGCNEDMGVLAEVLSSRPK